MSWRILSSCSGLAQCPSCLKCVPMMRAVAEEKAARLATEIPLPTRTGVLEGARAASTWASSAGEAAQPVAAPEHMLN